MKTDIEYLQSITKTISVIDTLAKLGEDGEIPQIPKESIKLYLKQKTDLLRESAKNPYDIPSARSDLWMLSRISIAHYHDLKGEVFNLLIQMFEEDPITPSTAVNLLKLIIDLNGELVLSKIQLLTIPFQKKMARAFSASVELYTSAL